MNKLLILDVGGVLATNLTPALWEHLAELGQCKQDELYADYKKQLSQRLWRGECSEEDWRIWLAAKGIPLSLEQSNKLIAQHLQPLPAIHRLQLWAQHCSIVIMSNHRSEWLLPLLSPYSSYLEQIYISDQAGLCKPDANWFKSIDQSITKPCEMMFVDDSQKNITAAQQVGWLTVLADEAGGWTAIIDEWLNL